MPMEYRPQWSVPGAGPSQSVFHFNAATEDLGDCVTAIRGLFAAVIGGLPNEVTVSFPTEVFDRDVVTGELEAIHTVSAPASVTGTNSGTWIGGAGAVLRWETGVIVAGRRLRGRTFLVPIGASFFESNGTLLASVVTQFQTNGNALITALDAAGGALVVWSQTHGVSHLAVSTTVPDRSAILRSRRD
jgi:hypothetical protein